MGGCDLLEGTQPATSALLPQPHSTAPADSESSGFPGPCRSLPQCRKGFSPCHDASYVCFQCIQKPSHHGLSTLASAGCMMFGRAYNGRSAVAR